MKGLRALFKFALEEELADADPTIGVKSIPHQTEGHHTWTSEEIAQFEACHPIGTKARLAMALMLYTACRRGDVIRLGPQHIQDGRLNYRQMKNRKRKPNDLSIPVHDDLRRIIDETSRKHMTFLVTEYGKPFSVAGFGNWFRETKENDVSLILGTSAYTTNSKDRFPVFRLGECAPLYIRKTDDGLSVDFDMYTPRKDLISRFLDNDWNLVTSEFSYQKHPDRSTLQVFDKKGNELFFIRYLNSKVIWMRGAFSCGTQDPIIVSNESVTARSDNFIMGNIVGAPGSSAKLVIADSDESAML